MANKTPNNKMPSNKYEAIPNEQNKVVEEKWTTNAKWIVFLLVLLVIVLVVVILTERVSNGDNLVNAVENFSTILSIVLSVSSIAFAGYTSIETGRQYHNMSRAVTQIETANKIMSENYRDLLKHYHDTVRHFSNQLRYQSTNQTNHVPNTPSQIIGVKGNATHINTPKPVGGNVSAKANIVIQPSTESTVNVGDDKKEITQTTTEA